MKNQKKLEDDNIVLAFKFDQGFIDEMQRWIDLGYFEDLADATGTAFGMVRNAVTQLENDKLVVPFNEITLNIEVELPQLISSRVIH